MVASAKLENCCGNLWVSVVVPTVSYFPFRVPILATYDPSLMYPLYYVPICSQYILFVTNKNSHFKNNASLSRYS